MKPQRRHIAREGQTNVHRRGGISGFSSLFHSQSLALSVLLVVYFALAGAYATRTPAWQAPDEPAHYNYVRQIVEDRALPVLRPGDWQQAYQETLTASGFRPDLLDRLDTIQYEDHQPPLYYLLQAPVYALTDGDLRALRAVSVLLGAGVVLCAWAVLSIFFPRRPILALVGAGFVAFLPQHLAILGSVSNDALAELIVGLTLLAAARYLGQTRPRPPIALGLLVGAALLTKTTIYFLAGIAVLAVLLRGRRAVWSRRVWIAQLAAVIVPALLLGGIWWARNVAVYGGSDFTGLQRHDAVTVGQWRTDDYIELILGGDRREYVEIYARTTFHSFWGQFGWMALPMPTAVYWLLGLFTVGVLIGAGLALVRRRRPPPDPAQRDLLVIGVLVVLLVSAAYLLYNRDFVQFQGRYLYPALIPLAGLVALGIGGWLGLIERRWPALVWTALGVPLGLALLAFYALETYIVPNLPAW